MSLFEKVERMETQRDAEVRDDTSMGGKRDERRINLVEIKKELNNRGSEKDLEFKSIELTDIFSNTSSKIIASSIKKNGGVYGIKLKNFKGILGKDIQKSRRFGTELADHVKTYGLSGLFHIDELPNYGITADEVNKVKTKLKINELDSFVIVTGNEGICYKALEEVFERCLKKHFPECRMKQEMP